MLNVYDFIANNTMFKKFEVNDLLFIEYKCILNETRLGYWTHNNYFVYVVGGKKKWISGDKEYMVKDGEAIFIRKGAYMAHNYFDEDFCALLIFVPDDFIKTVVNKYASLCAGHPGKATADDDAIVRLQMDDSLYTYFHSLLSYFPRSTPPPKELLTVKFEELILNVLTGSQNRSLASYFFNVHETGKVSVRHIMETCFMFNMSLDEYAKLCARSLSTFKADFYEIYKTTPGKWLIAARLRHAHALLETTGDSINDIAFKSGFKNTSHFVRVFKEVYGKPPLQHRHEVLVKPTVVNS